LRKTIQHIIFLLTGLLIIPGCANIVPLSGGNEDSAPPKLIRSNPLDRSVNYKGKNITITFDEFIVLNNVNQKLLVSPPPEQNPAIKLKGKTILISFKDDLKDSTTYSLNFCDAITDLTEGNAIPGFVFSFSTGPFIDSLGVSGKVINASDLKDEKNIFVMLYADQDDSVPLKKKPLYITRTDAEGKFFIPGISNGAYRIFALADVNSNYLFDLPDEKIAFLDTLIRPFAKMIETPDTVKKDSVVMRKSSLLLPDNIVLYAFKEDHDHQYIVKTERKDPVKCFIAFKQPLADSLTLSPVDFTPQGNWNILELNVAKDTLVCWITDTLLSSQETIPLQIKYPVQDTGSAIHYQTDTVRFQFQETPKQKKDLVNKTPALTLKTNISDVFDLNQAVELECLYPVVIEDTASIILSSIKDSVKIQVLHQIKKLSGSERKYQITAPFTENTSYQLLIPANTFTSFNGLKNDSISLNFKTREESWYGTLVLRVSGIKSRAILQFMNNKDQVLREYTLFMDESIHIPYLKPEKYRLRLIFDSNGNGKWDTGNYLKNLQPEKVINFPNEINIRSNWDVEQDWKLTD
jgi:hypothetical protein